MISELPFTPLAEGFRMPAEFEPHRGCWLLWPTRLDNWREGAIPAQQAFTLVATTIAAFEPVSVGVDPANYAAARAALPKSIRVVELASDDAWMRDVGPTCLVNDQGKIRGVDWQFNAWGGLRGGLYHPWDQDDQVAAKILAAEGLGRYRAPFICEGGAMHSDGQGTLLVTEECLLNPNRNPHLDQVQIEQLLMDYTGARCVVWLGEGVLNDETDGHIDNLACFSAPGEVVLLWSEDPSDPQTKICADAYRRLSLARDAQGRNFLVHKLLMPGPLYASKAEVSGLAVCGTAKTRTAGARLAASYVNFYLPNGGVVAPLLDSRTDDFMLQQLKNIFPQRRIVGVPAREILLGGGNIHCITQQIPLGVGLL